MTALLDPPVCSELSHEQRQVLTSIQESWSTESRWPLIGWIDKALDVDHGLDVDAILPTIPERYILYNRYSPSASELKLTIASLHCLGQAADVHLFMRVLHWCIQRERAFRPSDPTKEETLQLSAKDAETDWTASGEDVSPRILLKAFALADVEQIHRGAGRGSADPHDWTLNIDKTIRRYRQARTFDEYLATKERIRRELEAQAPIAYSPPPLGIRRRIASSAPAYASTTLDAFATAGLPVDAPGQADAEALPVLSIADIHPVVSQACRDLFALHRYREGAIAAVIAFRDQVRRCTGLNHLDGTDLMGRAFGQSKTQPPLLDVADPALDRETQWNIRQGMVHLSQGLWFLIRNPHTHHSTEIEPTEAMRIVGLVDLLVRRIENRPPATRTISSSLATSDAP